MTPQERRQLSRELSTLADASVREALQYDAARSDSCCPIVGITGAPGAGKSTLIGKLARARLLNQSSLAIVAIDPSSALSGGAILGDRIRMVDLAEDPRIYMRSLATRASRDGLADNLPVILERIAQAGFGEILLETTGVGQVEYAVRWMADTMVLVLSPDVGDQVQAMKSGLIEMPDIFVVNKSDQPGAEQVMADLRVVIARRQQVQDEWGPPVLMTRADDEGSFTRLSAAIDAHRQGLAEHRRLERARARRVQVVVSLMARRVDEVLAQLRSEQKDLSSAELFAAVARGMIVESELAGRAAAPGIAGE